MATASPVRMSGVARTRVPEPIAYHEPKEPRSNASSAEVTSKPAAWSKAPTHRMIAAMRPAPNQRDPYRQAIPLMSREGKATSNACKPTDRGDAQRRPDGKHRKYPFPTDNDNQRRNELDRHHRQQKAEGRLNGECRADSMWGHRLCHERTELRRIGDDEESPRARKRPENPHASSKGKRNQECAAAAQGHGSHDETLTTASLGDESAPNTTDSTRSEERRVGKECR